MVGATQFVAGTATAYREVPLELEAGRKFVVLGLAADRFVHSSGLSCLHVLRLELFSRNVLLIVCGWTRAIQAVFEFIPVAH